MSLLDEVFFGFQNYARHKNVANKGWKLAMTAHAIPIIQNGRGFEMSRWDSLESARAWFKENGYLK